MPSRLKPRPLNQSDRQLALVSILYLSAFILSSLLKSSCVSNFETIAALVTKTVNLHVIKSIDFDALVALPPPQNTKDSDVIPKEYRHDPILTQLTLDTGPAVLKGSFKQCMFAQINPGLPGGSSFVVAKQALGPLSTRSSVDKPLQGVTQLEYLADEVACLVWANALQNAVNVLVEHMYQYKEAPPFEVPRFKFVAGAIAIESELQKGGNRKMSAWLIEERIDASEQGPWRKFINNDSPIPLPFTDQANRNRAEFLAFSQHAQYMFTGKLAFVSDYQGMLIRSESVLGLCFYANLSCPALGGDTLLSDPQVITNP